MGCSGAAMASWLWRLYSGAQRFPSSCARSSSIRFCSTGLTYENIKHATIDHVLQVHRAEEYRANCIYAEEIGVLGRTNVKSVIQKMWHQEKRIQKSMKNSFG
uniref:Uncharacterized protein n=1 Tax=Vombatus ursinus TaxID=29139 RepID=A0A4X2KBX3_VOMUR